MGTFQEEQEAQEKELHKLAAEIAAELGEGWTGFGRIVKHEDGAAFGLSRAWRPEGMLHVHGHWPDLIDGGSGSARMWGVIPWGEDEPSINVSPKRGAVAMARDIGRRFLPKYLPLYEAAVEREQAARERERRTDAAAEKIAEAFEGEVWRSAVNGERSIRRFPDQHKALKAVTFSHFGEHGCTVKFSLPAELAGKFAKWLKTNAGAGND